MRWVSSLNLGQRIVLVIAWGGIVTVVSRYIISGGQLGGGGWFGYAPGTEVGFMPGGMSAGPALAVSVAAVVVWAAGAVWLLGGAAQRRGE